MGLVKLLIFGHSVSFCGNYNSWMICSVIFFWKCWSSLNFFLYHDLRVLFILVEISAILSPFKWQNLKNVFNHGEKCTPQKSKAILRHVKCSNFKFFLNQSLFIEFEIMATSRYMIKFHQISKENNWWLRILWLD